MFGILSVASNISGRNFKTLFPGRRTEGRDDHGWSVVRGPANLKMELSYFFGSWSHANNSLLKKGSVSAIHDCNLFCSWKIELLSCLSSTARWITKVTETYPGETQAHNGQGGTWNSQGSSIECWRSDIQISNFQVMRSLSWCDWAPPGENQFLINLHRDTRNVRRAPWKVEGDGLSFSRHPTEQYAVVIAEAAEPTYRVSLTPNDAFLAGSKSSWIDWC